jgi:hypothetical protein
MHAGAAIEPDANFVLAGGFELGDPSFFFVQHWPLEFAATLDDAISEHTYATRTDSPMRALITEIVVDIDEAAGFCNPFLRKSGQRSAMSNIIQFPGSGAATAISILKEIRTQSGSGAAADVAMEMIIAAAGIIARERGPARAKYVLALAGQALMPGRVAIPVCEPK